LYNEHLRIPQKQYHALFSEPAKHNSEQRQKLCELIFEKTQIPGTFLCKNAVLSCFASGRSTATIIDSGSTMTCATPIHDGYALNKCMLKYDIGGDLINDRIQKFIEGNIKGRIIPSYNVSVSLDVNMNKKYSVTPFPNTRKSYENYSIRTLLKDIKENVCRIPEGMEMQKDEKTEYVLPDGTNLLFPEETRAAFCEALFGQVHVKPPLLECR
jgi:actin-related protein